MTQILVEANKPGPALPDLADPLVNPHKLTEEDLKAYPSHLWPPVLKHGRKKVGLACIIISTNGSLNHLGEIGRRHNCQRAMLRPMEALSGGFVHLFQELCENHGWTADEMKELQGEIIKANQQAGPPVKILSPHGSGTLN